MPAPFILLSPPISSYRQKADVLLTATLMHKCWTNFCFFFFEQFHSKPEMCSYRKYKKKSEFNQSEGTPEISIWAKVLVLLHLFNIRFGKSCSGFDTYSSFLEILKQHNVCSTDGQWTQPNPGVKYASCGHGFISFFKVMLWRHIKGSKESLLIWSLCHSRVRGRKCLGGKSRVHRGMPLW